MSNGRVRAGRKKSFKFRRDFVACQVSSEYLKQNSQEHAVEKKCQQNVHCKERGDNLSDKQAGLTTICDVTPKQSQNLATNMNASQIYRFCSKNP